MAKEIAEFLRKHAESSPVSFHMPGHKGMRFYERNGYADIFGRLAEWDITEIQGADNLFQPESIILETMKKYETLYGAVRSYLLVNGSSAGIISSLLASVSRGGSLIMARNCHKSVFNALSLGDIKPVYAMPRYEEDFGVSGEVTAEEIVRCMELEPEASAVILPSPNYYGICSDIESISREVHKRGKVLIVDQAHGAHLKFFKREGCPEFPVPAEEQGADLVINSIHKTLASFTQTALLNVCSNRVSLTDIEDKLQMTESSSPSYPLMATLDINADILMKNGPEIMEEWRENIKWFYEQASEIKGLAIMKNPRLDMSKLNLDMSLLGLDGISLEKHLIERGIFPELVSGNLVMCMSGIGNVREDYRRLAEALSDISRDCIEEAGCNAGRKSSNKAPMEGSLALGSVPEKKEKISIDQAEGRTCAMAVIPYPPGIPVACPGEVFNSEVLNYIKKCRSSGGKVIGVDENLNLWVGR